MATAIEPVRIHRIAISTGLLVGLAVLLVTQDANGSGPYVLLALALCVALHGYYRAQPKRPWDGNDEPY